MKFYKNKNILVTGGAGRYWNSASKNAIRIWS